MGHSKSIFGGWRAAATIAAVAGLVCSAHAQQGRQGGNGGNRAPRPAAAPKQEAAKPQPAAAPRPRPAAQPKPAAAPRPAPAPQPKPAAAPRPAPAPQPKPAAAPRPAPAPQPKPAAAPRPAPAPQPKPAAAPRPAPAPQPKPAAAPRPAPTPQPKPAAAPRPAPAPQPKPAAAPRPAAKPKAPVVAPSPALRQPTPAPKAQKPAPAPAAKPAAPPQKPNIAAPKQPPRITQPAPKPAAPPVVVKRPEPPKAIPPRNTLNKPIVTRPSPAPPAAAAPKPRFINRDTTPRVISPGNSLVKASPQPGGTAATPAPRIAHPPRSASGSPTLQRSNSLHPGTAAVAPAPVTFREGPTHDSGLVRSNGLVRQIDHSPTYDHSYGGGYVVNGYSHDDYPWRHRSYVSYSNGYCAPAPVYPRWPYYSSPFYGSPLRSAVIYTSYDPFCSSRYYVPCPPTYTYCGPSRYSYCPPTYCAPTYGSDSWSFSFGFSSSSSWFGVSYGSSWSCSPSYWGYNTYRPYGYYDTCPPRHGWWHRPVWGWSTFSCDPWSLAEPRGPVYPFDTDEYTGAFGLTQAASIDASEQFEEAVYSTMRGRYDSAIEMTRAAVLSTPESFAPGQSELDKYQLQRATWALTVYENPPRAAVDDKDAAFMVAAIAALAGDHETAVDAASEARELGDDHPATLQLLQQLAMEDARADWGVQSTMR